MGSADKRFLAVYRKRVATLVVVTGFLSSTNTNICPGQTTQEAEMCAHDSVLEP